MAFMVPRPVSNKYMVFHLFGQCESSLQKLYNCIDFPDIIKISFGEKF